jgi:N-methylhydantoinase B
MKLDPVTFEILRNGYWAICTEANEMLRNVAYSPTISEGRDSSVSLVTSDGRLVSHGRTDMCPHMGTFEEGTKALIKEWDGRFEKGDVFIHNDPYTGGTHQNDVKIIRPLFVGSEFFGFGTTTAHWSDVGGPYPGTFNPQATECYAEGLRIPGLKVYEKEKPVKQIIDLLSCNMRVFPERLGELYGQYQACLLIERRVNEYVEKFGKQTVKDSFEETMNYSERIFKKDLKNLPDGTFEFADFGDMDIMNPAHPKIKVSCKLVKKGADITLDYTGSDPAPKGSWGFPRPALLSAGYAGTVHYFPHLAPLNHGIIRSLKIVSKPGTCVHVEEPTPVTGYCSGAYEKVLASTMGCWAQVFAQVKPEKINAFAVNLMNVSTGGWHPKKKRHFVSYLWMDGGLGARSYKDGPTGLLGFYIGMARNQPVEVHEQWYTMTYTNVEAVPDTCGHGKYRGGFAIERNFRVWNESVLTIHADREEVTPYGLAGGLNGGAAHLVLNKGTAEEKSLGMFAVGVKLKPGDHITFRSNGGGGFGNPVERDPKLVLEDVIDGFITLKTAREVYGVSIEVIDEEALQYRIDSDETEHLRTELRKKSWPIGLGPNQVNPYGKDIGLMPAKAYVRSKKRT